MSEQPDILDILRDLHHQATVERSHYYTGNALRMAIAEIERLHHMLKVSEAANKAKTEKLVELGITQV